MKSKKLYRSCENRVFGGVAGGLGHFFHIDPVFFRLIFIIATIYMGIGIVVYLAAWILIPNDPDCENVTEAGKEVRQTVKKISIRSNNYLENKEVKKFVGGLLVTIGALFLIKNLSGLDLWRTFWPAALIALGLVIIAKSLQKR